MFYVIPYLALIPIFAVLDFVWLSVMAPRFYRPVLGDILLTNFSVAPAIFFYFIYPIGLLVFAVLPALKSGSVATALVYGALFGGLAYATYDLTNHATLRNWTAQITLVDIAWGTFSSGLAAVIAYYVSRGVIGWTGASP